MILHIHRLESALALPAFDIFVEKYAIVLP